MLRQAMGKGIGDRVVWIQAEAGKLPLADASFEWVVCVNSFHNFRQPATALAEMRRVLRPGGSLVLVDWCDDYLTCKLCSWWLHWTDAAFYRAYALRECAALLEQAGFHIAQHRRFRVGWLWGLMQFVCRRQSPVLTIPSAS
jgi:ubiquinone/menaquinone biosynthesis C-methylase UbiE